MHARLTTVEFDTARDRSDALKLLSEAVQVARAMQGFEAAYYLDIDELHIVAVLMFDTEADCDRAIGPEYEALEARAQEKGARFTHVEQHRVVAFATNT